MFRVRFQTLRNPETAGSIVRLLAATVLLSQMHTMLSAGELADRGNVADTPAAPEVAATWLDSLRQTGTTARNVVAELSEDPDDFGLPDFSHAPADAVDDRESDLFASFVEDKPPGEVAAEEISHPRMTVESVFRDESVSPSDFGWHVLPRGLLYRSYLAAEKEPRMQFLQHHDSRSDRTVWDAVLGGRVGLLRHGSVNTCNPQGFQLDLEGAVFARVLPDEPSAMLEGSDYRVGLFGTWRRDQLSWKLGYYHISSHVGDEYLLAHPGFVRINYVRDSTLAGVSWDFNPALRIYGETGYAPGTQGGAEPLEFQFGGEYTPAITGRQGAPFIATNAHLRQDFDFEGGYSVVAGWGWQGRETGHRLRLGLSYYNGPSLQYEFFDRWENLVGGGIWLDY